MLFEFNTRLSLRDGKILLTSDGMTIDLTKCDTMHECHLALIGLATHCLTSSVNACHEDADTSADATKENSQPQANNPVSALGDQFRKQQADIQQQHKDTMESLRKQYETLTSQYADTANTIKQQSNK